MPSRRKYHAAEVIVTNCRVLLCKLQRDRLSMDLRFVMKQQILLHHDPQFFRFQKAAKFVQKTYRSWQTRKFLNCLAVRDRSAEKEHNSLKQDAINYAHSQYRKARVHRRLSEIEYLQTTFLTLSKLARHHLNNLDEKTLELDHFLDARVEALHGAKKRINDEEIRVCAQLENRRQILETVRCQRKFAVKLCAKSTAILKKVEEDLQVVRHHYRCVNSVHKFLHETDITSAPHETQLEWVQREVDKMRILMDYYDQTEGRILFEEQLRLNNDIKTLENSEKLFSSKVSSIEKLEGYEAEAFSLTHQVLSKHVDAVSSETLIEWIETNASKILTSDKLLKKKFVELHSFYCKQEDDMVKYIVFHENNTGIFNVDAIYKRSANYEFHQFDKQKWMKVYESQPWVQRQQNINLWKKLKFLQEHITIRRSELLTTSLTTSSVGTHAEDAKMLFPGRSKLQLHQNPASFNLSTLKNTTAKLLTCRVFRTKANVDKERIMPLPSRRDHELNEIIINLRKQAKERNHRGSTPSASEGRSSAVKDDDDNHLGAIGQDMERKVEGVDPLKYITDMLAMKEKDLNKIWKVFNIISNNAAVVRIEDIVQFTEAAETLCGLLAKIIGMILDEPVEIVSKVDFGQFVKAFCSFSLVGKEEMIKIVFKSIDIEGYGHIPKQRYLDLLDSMYRKKKKLVKVDFLRDSLSLSDFVALNETYPSVFFPLYQFQHSVRQCLLGTNYWSQKIRKLQLARKMMLEGLE